MLNKPFLRSSIGLFLLLCLIGCSDPDDEEGGIIGTGIRLEGTVTEIREFASNDLSIKATSGEVASAAIDDTGRYFAPTVKGDGPYLLRVDLGNSEYRYGIAFDSDRANVHSYTDVILRNWFESSGGDIDNEFEQTTLTTALPSKAQFKLNANHIFDLTKLVLASYELTGEELLTGNYDSFVGEEGVDQYLRSNPAIIQDQKISFVITEPLNQTQSTTKSDFAVFELATSPDTESPDIPASVKALPSASNEIVIVWEPASDNRGVAAYQVFRDTELIATTPFPVHIDNDSALVVGQSYDYQVIAVDASDNSSGLSVVATSSTLDAPDTISPPAPVQLSVNAVIGRMELIWGQMNIGDVVSFDVYRGRGEAQIEFLKSVTSTIMTDVTVSSGVQYCYQIVAVDASGNESDRSSTVCRTAEGQEVNRSISPLASSVPPLAGLNIPDTSAMTCTEEWDEFDISQTLSVDAGCYLVNESINVLNGGTLTLNPGVLFKLGAGLEISVNSGGVLSSKGTKTNPVVLTGQDPTPGYWDGLLFRNSNSFSNELLNTVVEYAGSAQWGAAVTILADNGTRATLSVSDSVVRDCLDAGIKVIGLDADLRLLDSSVITECGWPLELGISKLDGVTQRNSLTGNDGDWVDFGGSSANLTEDTQIKDLGVPYLASSIFINNRASLVILAGVEIQFRFGAQVEVYGSLITNGESERRVRFTGKSAEPGHWSGLIVDGRTSLTSTDIAFAGSPNSRYTESASLLVLSDGNIGLSDVQLLDSSSFGLNVIATNVDQIASLNNIRVFRSARNIRMPIGILKLSLDELQTGDNLSPELILYSRNDINETIDLFAVNSPYFVEGGLNWNSGALRVHEGVVMHMDDGSKLSFRGSSSLSAVGSADTPIIMKSESNIPGAWAGIEIASSFSNNILDHVNLLYAGGAGNTSDATVLMNCGEETKLTISNTSISDSAGWGVFSVGDDSCSPDLGQNNSYFRNVLGNVGSQN